MGRARKPVAEQTKNLTVAEKKQRQFEEQLAASSRSDLSTPPDWLIDDLAVNEWKRVVKEISEELELIGNLDINNLGGFCNAFAMYVKATNELRNAQLLTIIGDGKIVENPLINTQKKYAEEMRKFGRLCGLTIDSRLKFAAEKAKTIDNDIEEEFGDI